MNLNRSILLSVTAALLLLSGCANKEHSLIESRISDASSHLPIDSSKIMKNFATTLKESDITKRLAEDKEKNEVQLAEKTKRRFNIRTGDSAQAIFKRLADINGRVYIFESESVQFRAPVDADNFSNIRDIEDFLSASGVGMKESPAGKYCRILLTDKNNLIQAKLEKIPVTLNGFLSAQKTIDDIAQAAGAPVFYGDKTASDIAGVMRQISFSGNGLDAINQIASRAGLSVLISDKGIVLSYFKTATLNLEVFSRDREMHSIINNIPQISSANNSGSTKETGAAASVGTVGANTDLKIVYATSMVKELASAISTALSPHGSYSFIAQTGQVIIRDSAEHVKVCENIVNDFNAKFKDTIVGQITFYKLEVKKESKRGLNITGQINKKIEYHASNMVENAFATASSAPAAFGASFVDGATNVVLQYLNEIGHAEILNPIGFEINSNTMETIKLTTDYGYIAQIDSTSSTGTVGSVATTGSIVPSSVPDGAFISVLAKPVGDGQVLFDIYATRNTLLELKPTVAFGTTIQTPDTSTNSIDSVHRVRPDVPVVLASYFYQDRKDRSSGVPISALSELGQKTTSDMDTYIVITLEGKIK